MTDVWILRRWEAFQPRPSHEILGVYSTLEQADRAREAVPHNPHNPIVAEKLELNQPIRGE